MFIFASLKNIEHKRRGAWVAERAGLLNRYTSLNLYRGFESLPLRIKNNNFLQKPANIMFAGFLFGE